MIARAAAARKRIPGAEDGDFVPLRLRQRLAGGERKNDSQSKYDFSHC